jgi:hypothetical protein
MIVRMEMNLNLNHGTKQKPEETSRPIIQEIEDDPMKQKMRLITFN